jgi:hypothetical protein
MQIKSSKESKRSEGFMDEEQNGKRGNVGWKEGCEQKFSQK